MNIQSFIFNWRNQFSSTLSIESALHSCIDHVHVINSDENNFKPYWHNIGESSYFTSQFLKALELHDGETRQIVAERYAKDIEYFGYKFGE